MRGITRTVHRRIAALLALVLLGAGCGDGDDDVTTAGDEPGATEPGATGLDAEVVHLGEGLPSLGGPPAVAVLDPDDRETTERIFVAGERDAVARAVRDADLEGRTLLGGLVHEGCFPADDVAVEVVGDAVVFEALGVSEREGEVDCARAIVTSAIVSVATDALPAAVLDGPVASTPTTDPDVEVDGPEAGSDLAADVLLIEPTGYEPADTPRPGLIRDEVDLAALFGRYDLGQPGDELLDAVATGEQVLVAGVVGNQCTPPTNAHLSRVGDALELAAGYGPDDSGVDCDALAQALVVVAVAAEDVEGATSVNGDPADGPAGVGVTHLVAPLDVGAEPLAATIDDVDLASIPGAPPTLDLPPVEGGAVRLVFVVEACEPGTAELVADLAAGTVRAEAQQTGPRVECEALSPHLVVADLAEPHDDLEPTP